MNVRSVESATGEHVTVPVRIDPSTPDGNSMLTRGIPALSDTHSTLTSCLPTVTLPCVTLYALA